MKIKLKQIDIKGLRGVKDVLSIELNGKSIVLYGDNGMGKSSISDSIEWFYTNKVAHLGSAEIDLKDALRNAYLEEHIISEANLKFCKKTDYDTSKTLSYKNGKLEQDFTVKTDIIKQYIIDSKQENLILRYKSLNNFVDITKGDKLKYLSDIIGYSEITKKKEILRKAYFSINSEIKIQNFEGQILSQKNILTEKIAIAVIQEKDLFTTINSIISPLNLNIKIESLVDINTLLEHLKLATNEKLIKERSFLEKVQTTSLVLQSEIEAIKLDYKTYFNEFQKIAEDVEGIMKIYIGELLKLGDNVVQKYHKKQSCPLCLQPKKIDDLRNEIAERLKEIEEASQKLNSFKKAKEIVKTTTSERIKRIDSLLLDDYFKQPENEAEKKGLESLKNKIKLMETASLIKVTSGEKIQDINWISLNDSDFLFLEKLIIRLKNVNEAIRKDNITQIYANILASKDAFLKIKTLEKERDKLKKQSDSIAMNLLKLKRKGLKIL